MGHTVTYLNGGATTPAQYNPFRYRSYYFDTETGLYYVSSRYYDPEVGRFINADGYISTGQGLLGYNMFAYCLNNPVNMQDPFGEIAITTLILIGSIVAGCLVAGHTAATSYKYTGKVDVGNTILAEVGTFLTVYTWGMSAYTAYLTYCDYKGYTPVTEIGSSSNASSVPTSQPHGNSIQSTKKNSTTLFGLFKYILCQFKLILKVLQLKVSLCQSITKIMLLMMLHQIYTLVIAYIAQYLLLSV